MMSTEEQRQGAQTQVYDTATDQFYLHTQVYIEEGDFWMGSQVMISSVLAPVNAGDGGGPRRKLHVKYISAPLRYGLYFQAILH